MYLYMCVKKIFIYWMMFRNNIEWDFNIRDIWDVDRDYCSRKNKLVIKR